jgi:hypothetical protein
MDRKRNSEKLEPQEHPIEPEMGEHPGDNLNPDAQDPAQPEPAPGHRPG